jgi:hypothetical protein
VRARVLKTCCRLRPCGAASSYQATK